MNELSLAKPNGVPIKQLVILHGAELVSMCVFWKEEIVDGTFLWRSCCKGGPSKRRKAFAPSARGSPKEPVSFSEVMEGENVRSILGRTQGRHTEVR